LAIFVVYPVVCFCGDNVDNKTSERLVRDYFPLEEGWAYMYRDMEGKASYTLIKAYERNGLKGYYFMTHDEQHKESPLFIEPAWAQVFISSGKIIYILFPPSERWIWKQYPFKSGLASKKSSSGWRKHDT